jgi:hypothetical protein
MVCLEPSMRYNISMIMPRSVSVAPPARLFLIWKPRRELNGRFEATNWGRRDIRESEQRLRVDGLQECELCRIRA